MGRGRRGEALKSYTPIGVRHRTTRHSHDGTNAVWAVANKSCMRLGEGAARPKSPAASMGRALEKAPKATTWSHTDSFTGIPKTRSYMLEHCYRGNQ